VFNNHDLINDLKTGGAQNTMKRILDNLKGKYAIQVITFFELGPVGKEIQKNGYEVQVFDKWELPRIVTTLRGIYRFIRKEKPDFIISFLYFSDLVGGLIGKLASRKTKVIWNVRNDLLRWGDTGKVTFAISRLNVLLSYLIPYKIIYCSKASAISHTKLGYKRSKAIVCENNIDTSLYAYNKEARTSIRESLSVDERIPVFCMACRYDKIKNIPLYLESIKCFYEKYRERALFILCGEGISYDNAELSSEIERIGVKEFILLKDYVDNMPRFLSAVDCIVVTSKSEGSPNIIYEGLASGANCIVSNLSLENEKTNGRVNMIAVSDPCAFADSYHEFGKIFAGQNLVRSEQKNEHAGATYIHNLSKQITSIIEHA
jgi:hypothetical protein